ncbi:hypothetical protein SAMN05421663_10651 [Terribacillus halophilus]|uniref:DUF2157 domain-containing protein n=1 Tax=Terribacillus halophilus TaxID=361279 RepID=A0A1G6RHB4_9BACI|nr:hypothetical protein [Terribacillus halophilus]SDD03407.1 hypothetical protein SAMN05421663_10651 [Terribacillus halophilus]
MANMPPNKSEDLFERKLQDLFAQGYISDEAYTSVLTGYRTKLVGDASKRRETQIKKAASPVPQTAAAIEHMQASRKPAMAKNAYSHQKQKKQKTPEQIRERNLTIILVLGIIMLFFGGLYLGTSNWGNFSSLGKVLLISLIPFLFAGLSYISYKVAIPQTAFAFLMLAALFVPIVIFSASYYQLFGSYLSFGGDGAALIGTIAALGCTALYYSVAARTGSKAFIWVTYVGLSTTLISALLYMTTTYSAFLFCLQLANFLLLLFERTIRKSLNLQALKRYWPYYLQMKLGTEAVITIILMSSAITYDLTVLLIGINALILAAKNFSRLYHFGFMAFTLISGILLLLEFDSFFNMFLGQFLSVGFILVLLTWNMPRWLQIVYECLIHAINGFIFLIFTSLIYYFVFDWAYLIGILFLLVQYTVWTAASRNVYYSYPSVGLILVVFYWLLYMIDAPTWLYTGTFATLAFIGLAYCYIWPGKTFLRSFQKTINWVAVGLVIPLFFVNHHYSLYEANSYLLLLVAAAGFFCYRKENTEIVLISKIITPVSLIAALYLGGYRLYAENEFYQQQFGIPGHATLIAIVALGIAFLSRKYQYQPMFLSFFLTGQILQSLAALLAILSWNLPAVTVTLVTLINVGIQFIALTIFRKHPLWAALLGSIIVSYASLQDLVGIEGPNATAAYLIACAVLLFAGSLFMQRRIPIGAVYFFWCSHAVAAFAIMWVFFAQSIDLVPPAWLFLPLAQFVFSAHQTKRMAERFIFANVSIFMVFILATTHLYQYTNLTHLMTLSMALTAICTASVYALLPVWRDFLRFSLLAVYNMMLLFALAELTVSFSWQIILLSIIVGIIAVYQQYKWQLDLVSSSTLFLLLAIILLYGTIGEEARTAYLLLAGAIALAVTSFSNYQSFVAKAEKHPVWNRVDVYRISAIVYALIGSLAGVNAYESGLADTLFGLTIPALLFAISMYTAPAAEKRYVRLAAIISCLYPYLLALQIADISPYLSAELHVVPVALLVLIILRLFFYDPEVTPHIELILLSIGFGVLVIDGLSTMTIYDALSLGSLSLAAAVIGFLRKYRAYFLTGTITVVFNLFFNTRMLWGSAPWWLYLIGAGLLLIASASYMEYQKQKHDKTTESLLKAGKSRWKQWFKQYK